MESRYIAAVDIGSCNTSLIVGSIEGYNVQVLHYARTASEGVRYGSIFNPQKASGPVKRLISEAQEALGIKINQVLVALPRYYVKQFDKQGELRFENGDTFFSAEDIASLKNIATDDYPLDDPDNDIVFSAIAQSFNVEDNYQVHESEVEGMVGNKITGNFKVFAGSRKAFNSLTMVMNNAGLAFRQIFTPESTALATLTEEEKETGVALVELGGGVSSVSIFRDGLLRYFASTPFGGKSVTNDIKQVCSLSGALAENIKLAFGGCIPEKLPSLGDKTIRIDYKENATNKQIPVKYLSEIITSREREIAEALLYYIQKSGLSHQLGSGIVITGGGANIVNISALFKEMSGYEVRIGYPLKRFSFGDFPGVRDADAATVVGMLLNAVNMPHFNSSSDVPYVGEIAEPADSTAQSEEEQDDDDREILVLTPEETPVKKPNPVKPRKKSKLTVWINDKKEAARGAIQHVSTLWNEEYEKSNDDDDI